MGSDYYVAVVQAGSSDNIKLQSYKGGTSDLAAGSATISNGTDYVLPVRVAQRHMKGHTSAPGE